MAPKLKPRTAKDDDRPAPPDNRALETYEENVERASEESLVEKGSAPPVERQADDE